MIRKSPIKILFILAMALFATSSLAQSRTELQQELTEVAGEIAAAELMIDTTDEPAVRQLTVNRLALLQLTQEILRNRILLLDGQTVETIVVNTTNPNMADVAQITADMVEVEASIKEAEDSLITAEGINRAIVETRLESEKLAKAQLRIAYIGARYGSTAVIPAGESSSQDQANNLVNSTPQSTASVPIWADSRHPDIDYTNPLFQNAYEGGAQISGWWTISSNRGSDSLVAQNLSQYFPDAALDKRGMLLQIRCTSDLAEVSIIRPGQFFAGGRGVDVSYRTDNGPFVREVWAATTGGGASIEDADAIAFIDGINRARMLSVDVSDAGRSPQSADFQLAGFYEVEAIARSVCSQRPTIPIELSRQDYRLVQSILNVAGFNAGIADGVWGRNSERAMRDYQVSAGLVPTGRPDRPTLEKLGLLE